MLRLITGVILGYLVFALSAFLLFRVTAHNPHEAASLSYMASTLVYGIFFAFVAGLLASWLAGRRDLRAAQWVAVILVAVAVISMATSTVSWSQVMAVLFMAPMVLVGGWVYRQRGRKSQS